MSEKILALLVARNVVVMAVVCIGAWMVMSGINHSSVAAQQAGQLDPSKGLLQQVAELRERLDQLIKDQEETESKLKEVSRHAIVRSGTITKRLDADDKHPQEGLFFVWQIEFEKELDFEAGAYSVFVNARKGGPRQHCWASLKKEGIEVVFLDCKKNVFPDHPVTLDYAVVMRELQAKRN